MNFKSIFTNVNIHLLFSIQHYEGTLGLYELASPLRVTPLRKCSLLTVQYMYISNAQLFLRINNGGFDNFTSRVRYCISYVN
jgi:hypothetical protein